MHGKRPEVVLQAQLCTEQALFQIQAEMLIRLKTLINVHLAPAKIQNSTSKFRDFEARILVLTSS